LLLLCKALLRITTTVTSTGMEVQGPWNQTFFWRDSWRQKVHMVFATCGSSGMETAMCIPHSNKGYLNREEISGNWNALITPANAIEVHLKL